jgi:hypothetical protein
MNYSMRRIEKKNRIDQSVIKKKASGMEAFCDPAGTRTQGPYIKSVLLYQLSYEINP